MTSSTRLLLLLLLVAALASHSVSAFSAASTAITRASTADTTNTTFFSMTWLCLERCGYDATEIQWQADELVKHKDLFTAVSYEALDLGEHGSIIDNNFTNVGAQFRQAGLVTLPMVTTVDLVWMRQMFHAANKAVAQKFFNATLAHVKTQGADGINIDWEPSSAATNADATGYAEFLQLGRQMFAQEGKILSVAVAKWNTIWNWTAINAAMTSPLQATARPAPPSYVMSMTTYTYVEKYFASALQEELASFSASVMVPGMEVWHKRQRDMGPATVKWAFDELKTAGVCKVAIWQWPIMLFWNDHLKDMRTRCAGGSKGSALLGF